MSDIAEPDVAQSGSGGRSLFRPLVALFERVGDGAILQVAFFALLGAASYMLYADFTHLRAETPVAALPDVEPVLPAIDRPEIDPADPAFTPHDRLTVDPARLRQPLTISLQPNGVLGLEGVITPGSGQNFIDELAARGEYVKIIALNSPGGSIDDAMQIGRAIREHGYTTLVPAGHLCASSCPLVFAGGARRQAGPGAIFGVHQVFAATTGDESAAQALSDAQITTAEITRYLDLMGVSPDLWLHALETPPDKLFYLTANDLGAFNLVTD